MATPQNGGATTAAQHRAPRDDSVSRVRRGKRQGRRLSTRQIASIEYVIHLFVDEDLERGISPSARMHCAACVGERPRAGAIRYDRYTLCNVCATEYEVARVGSPGLTVGHFVRDKSFGEGERYALPVDIAHGWRLPSRGF